MVYDALTQSLESELYKSLSDCHMSYVLGMVAEWSKVLVAVA